MERGVPEPNYINRVLCSEAEFVGAYRPALQLLGIRAGSPKEEFATLGEDMFFRNANPGIDRQREAGALDPIQG